jgi:quinol monooxygenase YgiN
VDQDHEQIAACVRIVVKPELSDDLADLLTRMAELAARDDGTEIWAVHRGRKGSGEFFVYELFRDRPAFELHQRNEALDTLGRQLAELADDLVVTSGRLVGGLRPRTDGALRQGHSRVNRRRSYIVISSK